MPDIFDHTNLHRTAKYFMDNGRAESPEAAMTILEGFGLSVVVGRELATSRNHQIALLTLVNTARRTFLGGIEVSGLSEAPLLVALATANTLQSAVRDLGGRIVETPREGWPVAVIGTPANTPENRPAWGLHWSGWRGGVLPVRGPWADAQSAAMPLAPVLAAALCVAEVFAFLSGDHPMSGLRTAGLSLWSPGLDWQADDPDEPALSLLPSRLWLIGLGNLGQAYAWLLACLPYIDSRAVEVMLQDFDDISESNDSTSLLSTLPAVGLKKTRLVAGWLETRGFTTMIEERRFGEWTRRAQHEPGVGLCGVDNALARMALDKARFDLVVEAGLGAGPNGFRNFSLHTFPASRSSAQVWSRHMSSRSLDVSAAPAYSAMKKRGLDACGLAQLASRTVGVPFVGLAAGVFVFAELLRRLHGGPSMEQLSGSLLSVEDVESISIEAESYAWGHVDAETDGPFVEPGSQLVEPADVEPAIASLA